VGKVCNLFTVEVMEGLISSTSEEVGALQVMERVLRLRIDASVHGRLLGPK
jgi:hypothetical protein